MKHSHMALLLLIIQTNKRIQNALPLLNSMVKYVNLFYFKTLFESEYLQKSNKTRNAIESNELK